jgi:hypothetical protein
MTPSERAEFERMKRELKELKAALRVVGNRIILSRTVVVNGTLNADRLYTQRSGSYVELTS